MSKLTKEGNWVNARKILHKKNRSLLVHHIKPVLLKMLSLLWMPAKVERRVKDEVFQPRLIEPVLDRLVRAQINGRYQQLTDEQRKQYAEDCWSGKAGSSWIETKRIRYRQGEMEAFIQNVRSPFERMVIDFLRRNPHAILTNRKEAEKLGMTDRVHFICSDASRWFERQHDIKNVLVLSVATLKFFTTNQILELLSILKRKAGSGALALCEDVFLDFSTHAESKFTGTLGWSHNYPRLFSQVGYQLQGMEVRQADGGLPESRFLYAIASFS